jgi:hypothetical protein
VRGKLSTINPKYERERKRGGGMEGGTEGGRVREREGGREGEFLNTVFF